MLQQAEDGIKDFLDSEPYKIFLKTMSQFHTYSLNNLILIVSQMPHATKVAGYKTWKNTFNRQVNRGAKSIKIIGGRPYKKTVEALENGKKEKKTIEGVSFFPVSVFDISQTSGDPLPQLTKELSGDVEGYAKLFAALKQTSKFPVVFEELSNGVKGYCSLKDEKIAIKKGMSQSQTIKTLIHEMTHSELHGQESFRETTRQTKEVEAESCAYVVCDHFGIDTRDYSFPYLAAWSSEKELPELKQSFDRILKEADSLIQKVDHHLELIQKEMTQEKTNDLGLNEKLDHFEEVAQSMNEEKQKITNPRQPTQKNELPHLF